MKRANILEKDVTELKLSEKIIKKFKENSINIIEDVWKLKRKDLKILSFSDSDIMQIVIKLQLFGLDLNKKVY